MKTLEADTTKSKPPTDLPGDPPAQSPKEESGDSKSNPHPFDAYWFGFYCDSRGIEQISERDISGWSDELTAWVHGNGWRITDRQPNLFIIFKIDPVTKNKIDLPRRDFFQILAKFKELNEKYELCLGGVLIYDKKPPAQPHEVCSECFQRGQHIGGDSIGRPIRSQLPSRKKRH